MQFLAQRLFAWLAPGAKIRIGSYGLSLTHLQLLLSKESSGGAIV